MTVFEHVTDIPQCQQRQLAAAVEAAMARRRSVEGTSGTIANCTTRTCAPSGRDDHGGIVPSRNARNDLASPRFMNPISARLEPKAAKR